MAAKLRSEGRIVRRSQSPNSKSLKLVARAHTRKGPTTRSKHGHLAAHADDTESQRPLSSSSGTSEVAPITLIAAVSAAVFVALSALVASDKTRRVDQQILEHTSPSRNHVARKVARALSPIGNWKTNLLFAAGIAPLLSRNTKAGGAAVMGSALAGFALNSAFDKLFPQPVAPPGQAYRFKPVYPSGHTLGPTAIGLTVAHIVAREGRANAAVAFPLAAAIPVVLAAGRMLDAHHWATDILGGYLGGISVAASAAAVFERLRNGGS